MNATSITKGAASSPRSPPAERPIVPAAREPYFALPATVPGGSRYPHDSQDFMCLRPPAVTPEGQQHSVKSGHMPYTEYKILRSHLYLRKQPLSLYKTVNQ